MAKGHKTGGRGPGGLNRATAEVRTLAASYGPPAIRALPSVVSPLVIDVRQRRRALAVVALILSAQRN